jgi:hypothetical protein
MCRSGTTVQVMPASTSAGIMRSLKHISAGKKPVDIAPGPQASFQISRAQANSIRSALSSSSGLMAWWKPASTGSSRRWPCEVLQPIAVRVWLYQLVA